VAIVIAAVVRIGSRSITNSVLLCFAVAAFLALAVFQISFPVIVAVAGGLGWFGAKLVPDKFRAKSGHGTKKVEQQDHPTFVIDDNDPPPIHAQPSWSRVAIQLIIGIILWATPIAILYSWQGWEGTHPRMGTFFTMAALVTFGGAYAVLPYVAHQSVNVYGWMKPGQMIDGLALGETTPGPLIMIVAFVGFVGGWQSTELGWTGAILGCVIATYFTFLPSFLFILIGAPFIEQMREDVHVTAALTGITAAVVGVIFNLAVFFGQAVFFPNIDFQKMQNIDWASILTGINFFGILLAVAAYVALSKFKMNVIWVVFLSALCGIARYFFFSNQLA